ALAYNPMLLVLPAAVAAAYLLASSPMARILFVVFGGMLVFQSSDSLSLTKLAYFAGTAFAASTALLNASAWATESKAAMRPLLNMAVAPAAVILLTILPVYFGGMPVEAWVRDATPYLLGASVPLFAMDASRMENASLRSQRLLVVVGLFAA